MHKEKKKIQFFRLLLNQIYLRFLDEKLRKRTFLIPPRAKSMMTYIVEFF